MRCFAPVIFLLILASCDSTESKDTVSESLKPTVTQENLPAKDTTLPILIARGSEPGWYAEFYSHKLRLLYHHGEDSLHLKYDFSGIVSQDNHHVTTKLNNDTFAVEIRKEPCTEEASGEKRERSIEINWKGEIMKGCATSKLK